MAFVETPLKYCSEFEIQAGLDCARANIWQKACTPWDPPANGILNCLESRMQPTLICPDLNTFHDFMPLCQLVEPNILDKAALAVYQNPELIIGTIAAGAIAIGARVALHRFNSRRIARTANYIETQLVN